jgi:hypothetical protein
VGSSAGHRRVKRHLVAVGQCRAGARNAAVQRNQRVVGEEHRCSPGKYANIKLADQRCDIAKSWLERHVHRSSAKPLADGCEKADTDHQVGDSAVQ